MDKRPTDLRWVRADRLCLGDVIVFHDYPDYPVPGVTYEVLVDRLDLTGDDVTVSGWDTANSKPHEFTTSIGNGLRVKRQVTPEPRVPDAVRRYVS